MKIARKEIGIAIALTLAIVVLSIFYNTAPQRDDFADSLKFSNSLSSTSALTIESSAERIRIMDADILGKLENGTFEMVVPFIEALTGEKGGFIVTEHMTFKEGLWRGEIISKLPPANASTFTMGIRQKIDECGRVVHIEIDIRDFTQDLNVTGSEQYSTITTFLSEEFEKGKETPEPVIQLMSVFQILITGLVWVAGGLIVGVPVCFVSLGIVILVKRIIIPLWKKELGKPM